MSYTRTTWETSVTPLSAANMNNIEDGIEEAKGSITTLTTEVGAISEELAAIAARIYPVGSIYMSVTNTDPATLFGGTWEPIKDMFLLSAGDNYSAGDTGGSADAVVPYHRHDVAAVSNAITGGGHTHAPGNSGYRFMSYNFGAISAGLGELRTYQASSGSNYVPYVENSSVDFAGVATTSNTTHTHNLPSHATNYVGTSGNATGANMPPYLAVYVWKRTA